MAKNHNSPDNDSVLSLQGVLSQRVEAPESAHFDVDFENVEETAEVDETEYVHTEPVEDPIQPEPVAGERLSFQDIGVIFVNVLDGLQRTGFGIASKRMRFTQEELELLPNLDATAKTIYPEGSNEKLLIDKYKRHIAILQNLPFTKEEKDRLVTATVIYAQTVNLQLSPIQGLIAAYGEVLITRGFTVFGDALI